MSGPYYGYTSWNYGYTLCPETGSQYYRPPVGAAQGYVPRGRGGGRGNHFARGGGRGGYHNQYDKRPEPTQAVKAEAPAVTAQAAEVKNEATPAAANPPEKKEEKEDGEIIERPLEEILKGRNAVMFCNDQSKTRGLRMEWEQISETGPPHSKIFTWSLKMGDMLTMGTANNKKGAKNKAAEEMARKLDKLPKVRGRFNNGQRGGFAPNFAPRGGGFVGGVPHFPGPAVPGAHYNQVPPPWMQPGGQAKKRKFTEVAPDAGAVTGEGPDAKTAAPTPSEIAAKLNYQSLNNPISKLYEYCKQRKMPEPHFETLAENVLEKRKTAKGFVLKKTEFTIQVEVQGKKFLGTAMTKKQAKYNASEAAWAEFGGGVAQPSIDALLQGSRNAAAAASMPQQ